MLWVEQAGRPYNMLAGYPPNSPDLNPAENAIGILKGREKKARKGKKVDAVWIYRQLKEE